MIDGCPVEERLAPLFVSRRTTDGQTGLESQVRTAKGEFLPAATVMAVSLEPDFRVTTQTGHDGTFRFADLPPARSALLRMVTRAA